MTWVAHDLGQAAVALLTNYSDPSKRVLGKSYPVVSFRLTYPEFAAAIAKGAWFTFIPFPVVFDKLTPGGPRSDQEGSQVHRARIGWAAGV
jgi:hypothetical protein